MSVNASKIREIPIAQSVDLDSIQLQHLRAENLRKDQQIKQLKREVERLRQERQFDYEKRFSVRQKSIIQQMNSQRQYYQKTISTLIIQKNRALEELLEGRGSVESRQTPRDKGEGAKEGSCFQCGGRQKLYRKEVKKDCVE